MVKRLFDIVASGCGLLVLSPLFVVLAIWIKLDSKGPVFFKQKRVGIHKTHFSLYKFRSMKENSEGGQAKLAVSDDDRLTKIGRTIRRFKLDELPQLINILKGDISIVGPRPIVEKETEIYGKEISKLLSVKPGLTGYWQAYARNNATYESGERQKMEMYYVENKSLWLDFKILCKTFTSVLKREGAQ